MLQKRLLLNVSHGSSPQLCRERWGERKKSPSHTKQGLVKLKSSAISQPAIERISCNLFSDCRAFFFPQGLGEAFPAFMKGLKLSSIFSNNILVQGKGMERKKQRTRALPLMEDTEHGLTGLPVRDYYCEHNSRGSHSLSMLPFLLHLLSLLLQFWGSSDSRSGNSAHSTGTQYVLPCYRMRVRGDLRQMAAAGKGCSFGFTTNIHINTPVPGDTSKQILPMHRTTHPLTYSPFCFALNRHYCPKENSLKLVSVLEKKNKN